MISSIPALTDMGKSLLLRGLNGDTITFTRIKIGSGQLVAAQSGDGLDDLINAELSVAIYDVDTSQAGLIALKAEFSNEAINDDFEWRELGVFAKGGDNTEHLFAYANDGDAAGTLRKLETDLVIEQTLTLIIEVGDVENISAIFTPPSRCVEVGTYTGDGTQKRLIPLGFRPISVMLCNEYGQTFEPTKGVCGGIAAGTMGLRVPASATATDATVWDNDYTALLIAATGFYVNYKQGTDETDSVDTNESGVSYRYIAFR